MFAFCSNFGDIWAIYVARLHEVRRSAQHNCWITLFLFVVFFTDQQLHSRASPFLSFLCVGVNLQKSLIQVLPGKLAVYCATFELGDVRSCRFVAVGPPRRLIVSRTRHHLLNSQLPATLTTVNAPLVYRSYCKRVTTKLVIMIMIMIIMINQLSQRNRATVRSVLLPRGQTRSSDRVDLCVCLS